LRARDYAPGSGRFLTRDTLETSGPGTQGYNRYAYALDNPVTRTDPSGHASITAAAFATVTAGVLSSFAFSVTAEGTIMLLGAVAVTPVMAFLLMAVIFITLLVLYDLLIPCVEAARFVTCDGKSEGFGLGTLVGTKWLVDTATTGTGTSTADAVERWLKERRPRPGRLPNLDPFWPIIAVIGLIGGIISDTQGGPEGETGEQPDTKPEGTQNPDTPTPEQPTPTPQPDNCDDLNRNVPPNFKWGNPQAGGTHILDNHSWTTAPGNRGRFYAMYSTKAQIDLMVASALALRIEPWILQEKRCRVQVDLSLLWGLVGETREPRQPTSTVEMRVNVRGNRDNLESMYPV
jgi:hypothetical protein